LIAVLGAATSTRSTTRLPVANAAIAPLVQTTR
jgi:hypothetical protein